MADSTPPSRSRSTVESADDSFDDVPRARESQPRRPLRLIDQPIRPSSPSHPPSEPRPIPGRPGADASNDRPARVQLIAALLLLLVLVVVPLYLWRRPRAAATDEGKNAAALALASAQIADTAAATPSADPKLHSRDGVTVSDSKILGCHDAGSKRTAPGACDRVPTFEAAIAKAVLDSAACVPQGTAGAISFHVDASYARHKNPIRVTYTHEATTLAPKIASACAADVKKALSSSSFDQAHAHTKYEIAIDATYKR